MVQVYTADQVTNVLIAEIDKYATEAAFSDAHSIKRVNINRTVHRKIKPGGSIAEAIGYRRILLEAFVKLEDLEDYKPPKGYTLLEVNTTGGTSGGRPPSDKRKVK